MALELCEHELREGEMAEGQVIDRAAVVRALDERAGLLSAQIHALSAELAGVLAEIDANDGWSGYGYRSFAHWVSVRTKFTPADSHRLVAVAQRVDDMPTLMADARAGRVSVGMLANAARVVTADNEDRVADIVRRCTPSQAARVLGTYRGLAEDSADDERSAAEPEPESWWRRWTDRQGRTRIDAAIDGVTGELLEQARQAVIARMTPDEPASGEELGEPTPLGEQSAAPWRPRASDVAAAMAETLLTWADRSGVRDRAGERFAVQVTCDIATLAQALGVELDRDRPILFGARAYLSRSGRHLSDGELARAVCDGTVQLLIDDEGQPLWLGREKRLFSRQQRRAFRHRAGGQAVCEYPGCPVTHFVQAHHIVDVNEGGLTDLDAGVLLCGFHHRELHRRGWRVTRSGTQLTFWNARGDCLGSSGPPGPTPGPGPAIARLPFQARPPDPPPGIGPDSCRSECHGEPLTRYGLDVLIATLLDASPLRAAA